MSTRLPTTVRRLVAVSALWAFAIGMVLPLTLIYLHRVRGIPLGETGLLLGLSGLVALAAMPLVGTLTDRVGAQRLLPVVACGLGLAELLMAWAHSGLTALLPLTVAGLTQGAGFAVFSALLGDLCPQRDVQQRAFAVNFTVLNGGIGIGSLVSAAVVQIHHPGSFQVLYLAAAALDASYAGLLFWVSGKADHPPHTRPVGGPGYRALLERRGMALVGVAALLLALCGYAAVDSGLPAYGNVVAGVSPKGIALALSVNTTMIVVVQLWVLRLLRGRRLTRCLAVVGLVWAACWLLLGSSALPSSATLRSVLVLAFAGLFGVGETFMQPALSPLVNSVAGEGLRGRANAASSGLVSVAFVVSPALSAALVAGHLGGVWIGMLVALALGVSVVAVLLGRRVDPALDRGHEQPLPEPVLSTTG